MPGAQASEDRPDADSRLGVVTEQRQAFRGPALCLVL